MKKLNDYSPAEKKSFAQQFRFGLESEYLVVAKDDFKALWHPDLTFEELNGLFETISLEGIPSCEGMDLEPPQTKLMPFVVEGYHLPDMDALSKQILPKGVEIRTPICSSLAEVLQVHTVLFQRLRAKMNEAGYDIVSLSHHPEHSKFVGPQNKRRHDYWQWSMEVMTTYGPDINLSFPQELAALVSEEDLENKINYYGPALAALSVASPFVEGGLWRLQDGSFGKSFRMHKRSYIAPPVEFHPNEKNRYEFKVFDMPQSLGEIEAQFLSFISLVLDEGLRGRASKQSRIYDLGQVARRGLQAEDMSPRAAELLERSSSLLMSWGFSPTALDLFKKRLATGKTPADEMIESFLRDQSMTEALRRRSGLN